MKTKIAVIVLSILSFGCSKWHEVVMPYYNLGYNGERILPVSESDADFTFRAWVNYSTSIDRVFTVTYQKDWPYSGKLLEMEVVNKKKGRTKTNIRQTDIVPNSGFKGFIAKVNSLDLMNVSSQKDFQQIFDAPTAIMVIEIKSHHKFNHFRFAFYPADKHIEGEKYEAVRNLIVKEFNFNFYFPDTQKGSN